MTVLSVFVLKRILLIHTCLLTDLGIAKTMWTSYATLPTPLSNKKLLTPEFFPPRKKLPSMNLSILSWVIFYTTAETNVLRWGRFCQADTTKSSSPPPRKWRRLQEGMEGDHPRDHFVASLFGTRNEAFFKQRFRAIWIWYAITLL